MRPWMVTFIWKNLRILNYQIPLNVSETILPHRLVREQLSCVWRSCRFITNTGVSLIDTFNIHAFTASKPIIKASSHDQQNREGKALLQEEIISNQRKWKTQVKYIGMNPGNIFGSGSQTFEWELGRIKEYYCHGTIA